jgi:hypothetical protein
MFKRSHDAIECVSIHSVLLVSTYFPTPFPLTQRIHRSALDNSQTSEIFISESKRFNIRPFSRVRMATE